MGFLAFPFVMSTALGTSFKNGAILPLAPTSIVVLCKGDVYL